MSKYYGWFYAEHPEFAGLTMYEQEYGTLFVAMYEVNKDNTIDLYVERYGSGTLFADSVIADSNDLERLYTTAMKRNAGKQGFTVKGLHVLPMNIRDHGLHVKHVKHSTAEHDKQAINAIAKAFGFPENYLDTYTEDNDDIVTGIYNWLQQYDDPEVANAYLAVEYLSENLDANGECIMEYLPQDFVGGYHEYQRVDIHPRYRV